MKTPATKTTKADCQIKAFSNSDHVIVAWQYKALITDCIGFALFKKNAGEPGSMAVPLNNRIGFADQDPKPGEQRPSTEWPIQRFVWTDFTVRPADKCCYMVVPMLWDGTNLTKAVAHASPWSNMVEVATGKLYEAYFNRGIISSQFMSRQLADIPPKEKKGKLKAALSDTKSVIRQFLGGVLAEKFYAEIDAVAKDTTLSVYTALYQLSDTIMIEKLKSLGNQIHVVLGNGAFKSPTDDPNSAARTELKNAGLDVNDRMVTSGHFAHNKFFVFCKNNKPFKVWTGSTNTTAGGMYTEVNNAIMINDTTVAQWYFDEWQQLKTAGNAYPPDLIVHNSKGNLPKGQTHTWFASVNKLQDMNEARPLIDAAKQGVLFLFFNPGTKNTLYNRIMDLNNTPDGKNLFIQGMMNQPPAETKNALVFVNNGKTQGTPFQTVMPKSIHDEFGYWLAELTPDMVTIHSKIVVIDPFGKNPIVITGSHNLGEKASRENDDNINIIIGNKELAMQYAVNILSVYDHYRFRYTLSKQLDPSKRYKGLTKDRLWMKNYLTADRTMELKFLMG